MFVYSPTLITLAETTATTRKNAAVFGENSLVARVAGLLAVAVLKTVSPISENDSNRVGIYKTTHNRRYYIIDTIPLTNRQVRVVCATAAPDEGGQPYYRCAHDNKILCADRRDFSVFITFFFILYSFSYYFSDETAARGEQPLRGRWNRLLPANAPITRPQYVSRPP